MTSDENKQTDVAASEAGGRGLLKSGKGGGRSESSGWTNCPTISTGGRRGGGSTDGASVAEV